jgi:hypothetical protein
VKQFIDLRGRIVAVAHIVEVVPPSESTVVGGGGSIRLVNGTAVDVAKEDWEKVRAFFRQDCYHLLDD